MNVISNMPMKAILTLALTLVGLGSSTAFGQEFFITSTGGYGAATDYGPTDNSLRNGFTGLGAYAGTVGFTFTVGADALSVTELGYYDGPNSAAADVVGYTADGLNDSHEVGIFDSAGDLVASANVAAGTVDPATGDFRYVTLDTPVTLAAGATYTIAGQVTQADLTPSGDVFRDDNGGFTFGSGVSVPGAGTANDDMADFTNVSYAGPPSNSSYDEGVFAAPNEAGTGYAGANFAYTVVPEPATYALVLVALAGLAWRGAALRRF